MGRSKGGRQKYGNTERVKKEKKERQELEYKYLKGLV